MASPRASSSDDVSLTERAPTTAANSQAAAVLGKASSAQRDDSELRDPIRDVQPQALSSEDIAVDPNLPLPAPDAAVKTRRTAVRYGASIERDERLSKIVERERFLLSVVMPRFRTFGDIRREWVRRTVHPLVLFPCTLVLLLHIGMTVACAQEDSAICAGGPDVDADADADESSWAAFAYREFGPPMINALATLMLSFYANVCMGLYMDGYFAAKQLGESVLDLLTMVAGTIPPDRHEIRMEFWRCANLFHLCSYVLADKTRETYNLDNFLIPVAAAFGEVRRDPSAHEDS